VSERKRGSRSRAFFIVMPSALSLTSVLLTYRRRAVHSQELAHDYGRLLMLLIIRWVRRRRKKKNANRKNGLLLIGAFTEFRAT
jgi:hypothetical protein